MPSNLLFVEKQPGVVEGLRNEPCWSNATWVLPSRHDFTDELRREALISAPSAAIVSMQSVDLQLDEAMKRSLGIVANSFLERMELGKANGVLSPNCIRAAGPALRDRVFGALRPYFALRKLAEKLQPDKIVVVSRPASYHEGIASFLEASGFSIEVLCFSDGSFHVPARQPSHMPSIPKKFTPYPLFDADPEAQRGICVVTSVNDARTASLILPVVAGIQARASTTLVLQNRHNPSQFAGYSRTFGITQSVRVIAKGEKPKKIACPSDVAVSMAGALRALDGLEELDGFASPAVKLIASALAASVSVVHYTQVAESHFEALLRNSIALLVSPGGTLDAALSVEIANARGIPTIELQRGPVAKETVLEPPRSRDVLCIDEVSRAVYVGSCGYDPDRAHIVGSLKMDVDLSGWRLRDKKEAKAALVELGAKIDQKVLFLVGQPIDRELMRAVALIAMQASAKAGAFVVVKPHQEEDDTGLEIYRDAAKSAGLTSAFAITREISSVQCVAAADYVATYYSTVGLEGYALGRKVAAIAPGGHLPPFDLARVGAAMQVTNAEQLADLMTEKTDWELVESQSTKLLSDGLTKERIVSFVAEKSGLPHKRTLDGERVLTLTELKQKFNSVWAASGDDAALALLDEADHFSNEERKMLASYAQLSRGEVSSAVEGFSYFTLRDKTVPVSPSLEPWMGQEAGSGSILVWAQTGIGLGAEVMHLGFLQSLKNEWRRLHLVVDDRLVDLVKRSFRGLAVSGRSTYVKHIASTSPLPPLSWFQRYILRRSTPWRDCKYHCSIMTLGLLAEKLTGSHARPSPYINVDQSRVNIIRSRYGAQTDLCVGIAWKTTNPKQARRNIPDIERVVSILRGHGAKIVCLQHGTTPDEAERLRSMGVIVDATINPLSDVDDLFNQVAAMDCVVSMPNSLGHIAGSVGVPAILIVPRGTTPEWQSDRAAKFWYSTTEVIEYRDGEFETKVLKQLEEILTKDKLRRSSRRQF